MNQGLEYQIYKPSESKRLSSYHLGKVDIRHKLGRVIDRVRHSMVTAAERIYVDVGVHMTVHRDHFSLGDPLLADDRGDSTDVKRVRELLAWRMWESWDALPPLIGAHPQAMSRRFSTTGDACQWTCLS